jgi:peptidyl-prolyl cis-trans isomerase D
MFEFVRTHKRLMQIFLMLLIVPSFAFVGLDSYTRMRDGDNAIAKVGGKAITQQEFDAAQREQMDRYRQMMGEQFDPKVLESPEARQAVLDNLIAQRALTAELVRSNLAVSDAQLQQTILNIEGLRGADGKFDTKRYQELLAAQGMTPAMFEARLRQDLALQQLTGAIQSSVVAPKAVTNRISEIGEQEREVQEVAFRAADFTSQVKVTDDLVKKFYDQNPQIFTVPEQAKIEYVVLNNDSVGSQIAVSDADVEAFYKQNQQRFGTEEQRRASHILITAKKGAPAAEIAAAKTKAEGLLAEVRKNPASFAAVAKANSQDPGSAERGGDLEFFGRGMMVKPFEEQVFKMSKGQISDLVQSDFGFHIIQLTDVKPAAIKPLAEVKDQITAEIRAQLASKKYTEMAELLTNTVYEQADSLKPAADKLKLQIQTADGLTRTPSPALRNQPLLNNEKLLKAIFADDAIKNKRNTEAVEVAPNTLVAARVVEYRPAAKRPLAEVQEAIKARVLQTEAAKLARAAGAARLEAVRKSNDAAGFGAPQTVSRAKAEGMNPAAVQAIMRADASKLPAYVGVELPGTGYSIFRINKLATPAAIDQARRDGERQQIANAIAQQEMTAYVDFLKHKAKATVLKSPLSARAQQQP